MIKIKTIKQSFLERIKLSLSYDKDNGFFVWIDDPKFGTKRFGTVAGSEYKGYINIKFEGKSYGAHRLAWLFIYGYIPNMINHINRNPSDNRICNLRETTYSKNAANSDTIGSGRKYNFPKGVFFVKSKSSKSKRFKSAIQFNGKKILLGYFKTPEEAHEQYKKRHREIFGKHSIYSDKSAQTRADKNSL